MSFTSKTDDVIVARNNGLNSDSPTSQQKFIKDISNQYGHRQMKSGFDSCYDFEVSFGFEVNFKIIWCRKTPRLVNFTVVAVTCKHPKSISVVMQMYKMELEFQYPNQIMDINPILAHSLVIK